MLKYMRLKIFFIIIFILAVNQNIFAKDGKIGIIDFQIFKELLKKIPMKVDSDTLLKFDNNADGYVDIIDIAKYAKAYGTSAYHSNYKENFDMAVTQPSENFITGVVENSLHTSEAAAVKTLGDSVWARMNIFWYKIENMKENWDWYWTDCFINNAKKNNIKILGVLLSAPDWASGGLTNLQTGGHYPPLNADEYCNFVKEIVKRYGDYIKHWEIFNEPNTDWYWRPAPDALKYAEILKKTYITIKSIDPKAKVITGGLCDWPDYDGALRYLQILYDNGIKNYCDAIGIHPYNYSHSPFTRPYNIHPSAQEKIEKLIQFLENNNDKNKKIWITEIGWPTNLNTETLTETDHLRFLKETFNMINNYPQVESLFWYCLRDSGSDKNYKEQNFGIFNNDWQPKLSYIEFRNKFVERYKTIFPETPFSEIFLKTQTTVVIAVDMNGIAGANFVGIRGGAAPLSWTNNIPMYDDGTNGDYIARDGIYTVRLTFNAGACSIIEFKFNKDNTDNGWEFNDNRALFLNIPFYSGERLTYSFRASAEVYSTMLSDTENFNIYQAVAAAPSGSIITVPPGTHRLSKPLELPPKITLSGNNSAVIEGAEIRMSSYSKISGIIFNGGARAVTIGERNAAKSAIIENCEFKSYSELPELFFYMIK